MFAFPSLGPQKLIGLLLVSQVVLQSKWRHLDYNKQIQHNLQNSDRDSYLYGMYLLQFSHAYI